MAQPSHFDAEYFQSLDLRQSWPSPPVRRLHELLLEDYAGFTKETLSPKQRRGELNFADLKKPFSILCDSLAHACRAAQGQGSPTRHHGSRRYVHLLEAIDKDSLPQVVGSALAMLLHCDPRDVNSTAPTNRRRPRCRHSTYPNSPGLTRLMSDYVVERLQMHSIPSECRSARAARLYVDKLFTVRILDPSMEGGQLLLGIAESWMRLVGRKHLLEGPSGKRLLRAGLQKLCRGVLHGTDRNPLAPLAVCTAFRILSESHGLKITAPENLSIADSLQAQEGDDFDAVINNPPWGEQLTAVERDFIKCKFSFGGTHADTYLAFVEKSLRRLRPSGVYCFALPGTMIATDKASKARELLAGTTSLELLSLLPRQVFSDAAVRTLIVAGKKGRNAGCSSCRVVTSRRFNELDLTDKPTVRSIKPEKFLRDNSGNWTNLFLRCRKAVSGHGTRILSEVSTIRTGVRGRSLCILSTETGHTTRECEALFRRTAPFGYVPVILSRNLGPMAVDNIRFHTCLDALQASVLTEDAATPRIAVRGYVSPEGRLSAAPLTFHAISVKGVITVIPHGVNPHLLAAILCSSTVARWVASQTGALINPRFHTITARELSNIPIPIVVTQHAVSARQAKGPVGQSLNICRDIVLCARRLSRNELKCERKDFLLAEIDRLVECLYNE